MDDEVALASTAGSTVETLGRIHDAALREAHASLSVTCSHERMFCAAQELGDRDREKDAKTVQSERSAVVLAGGRSSRFGSNKALQPLTGEPLIQRVIQRISRVVGETIVVIGRSESACEYRGFVGRGVRVVNDHREGKNPLIGIVSGLAAARFDYVAIVACDVPFVKGEVIELLFKRALNADAAIPRWNRQRIEPLQSVYRKSTTLDAALKTLVPSNLSIEHMIRKLRHVNYVSVEDEIANIDHDLNTFFNINTKEDFAAAERMMGRGVN